MKRVLYFLLFVFFFTSCIKHRVFEDKPTTSTPPPPGVMQEGCLKINEFVAKGSLLTNEFGTASDWFELYNPTDSAITLESNKWFITDSIQDSKKFEVPTRSVPITIASHGFLVIYCDGLGNATGQSQIHASFKLSSAGSDIGIFYKQSSGDYLKIDGVTFGAQQSNVSMGRKPDGSNGIVTLSATTPGSSNN